MPWTSHHFEVGKNSRHGIGQSNFVSSVSSMVMKYCPGVTVPMKPSSEQTLINRSSSGRASIFCLCSRSRTPCARSLVKSGFIMGTTSEGETVVSGFSCDSSLPCRIVRNRRSQFFTHIRYCSVDTELIYGNNSAKHDFNSFTFTTKVYRKNSTFFAFLKFLSPRSSFQGTRDVRLH